MKTKKISRRTFFTSSLIGIPALAYTGIKAVNFIFTRTSTGGVNMEKIKKVIHRADSRGIADHGWLKSKHSFSFGSWYHPERMGFGLLRVINDDQVSPAHGFGTHPHQDMEIISLPLHGALKHKDSEGNEAIIEQGEVQLMSAGTGVYHSEYNASESDNVNFLQIWVMPEKSGIQPRYDQQSFAVAERKDQWQVVVSPLQSEDLGVKINQQAWFSLIDFEQKKEIDYLLHRKGNGVYFFNLDGEFELAGEKLRKRDALGIQDLSTIKVAGKSGSRLLAIEVPMA